MLVPTGSSRASYLLQKLHGTDQCSGTQMPKAGVALPAGDNALIEAWVCHGAQP